MTFRAIRADKTEQGQAVRFADMSEDELMPGDVTLQVTHSGVNYKDGLALSGKSPVIRRFPMVLGVDCAGIVLESTHAAYQARRRGRVDWLWPLRDAFWRLCRARPRQGRLAAASAARA